MTEEKGQTRPRYEYKVISGTTKKNEGWTDFDEQLNALADEGWEVFQSCAGSEGGFGMGVGSGGGGLAPTLVVVLRRPKP